MEATENIGGTSLQGYIKASYEQLLQTFGAPRLLNLLMVQLPLFTIGRMVKTIMVMMA
jgi:hypothetical protein